MKFNYRKISAIATSVLLTGMTMGVAAAAAFPSPFAPGSMSDAAIVYGASADPMDSVQAESIFNSIKGQLSGGSGDSTGEKIKIEQGSEKIDLSDTLTTVRSSAITDGDLPILLAKGTYTNDENTEYKYTQKIELGAGVNFTHISDSGYNDKTPTLGFKLSSTATVLNYTLDWTTNPESDVTSGDLVDIETTNMQLLGKTYYVLDAGNSSADITFLDSADGASVSEGETVTLNVDGKDYEVSINFIGASTVKLDVNGEITNTLDATSTNTYRLSDGAYVGIKEINTQDYQGGTKKVEFSIGKGKLKITNASNVKLNDKTLDDVYGYIYVANPASGGKGGNRLDKIVIEWKIDDTTFLTPTEDSDGKGGELLMPGFEAVKLSMEPVVFSVEEKTSIEASGDQNIKIKTTIADGEVTIPIFYSNDTTIGNISVIGNAMDAQLATSNTTQLYFNTSVSGTWQDDYFVASWNNSRDAESYYLSAKVSKGSDGTNNRTTITNEVTELSVCDDVEQGQTCTIGNVVLTVASVNYTSSTNQLVIFTINSGGSFNRLYSEEGLTIYLPWNAGKSNLNGSIAQNGTAAPTTSKGAINIGLKNNTFEGLSMAGSSSEYGYALWMEDEDKNGNLGGGSKYNVTIDQSGTSTIRLSVTAVTGDDTAYETASSSKIWRSYVIDELATMIDHDQSDTNKYDADITYHGSEVYATVYVAAPSATIGGVTLGAVVFTDAEKSSWETKNVIIVGGSCINTAAAEALNVASGTCTTAFRDATGVGAGQYLIQSVADKFTTGKIALVVAGYSKEDTRAAASTLVNRPGDVNTAAGNKYVGTVGEGSDSTILKVA